MLPLGLVHWAEGKAIWFYIYNIKSISCEWPTFDWEVRRKANFAFVRMKYADVDNDRLLKSITIKKRPGMVKLELCIKVCFPFQVSLI